MTEADADLFFGREAEVKAFGQGRNATGFGFFRSRTSRTVTPFE